MTSASAVVTTPPPLFEVDDACRLSHSWLWRLQIPFYESVGIAAWSHGIVPNYVTTNSFIARAYAKVILGFINDHYHSATHPQRVTIVEVGGGHGKFAFLVIRHLLELADFFPANFVANNDSPYPFRYVLTDVTQAALNFWQAHPNFAPLIAQQIIDFALVDADDFREVNLLLSGKRIDAHTNTSPIFVVANYLFDSLKHDAFRLVDGALEEGLVAIYAPSPLTATESATATECSAAVDRTDPRLIASFRPQWQYRSVPVSYTSKGAANVKYYSGGHAYLNGVLNRIIDEWNGEATSFLIPIGAIQLIKTFAALGRGHFALLCGDKAYSAMNDMRGVREPHIAIHGSFSLMVNYQAIDHAVKALSGFSLHTPHRDGFKIALFAGGDRSALRETALAFNDQCNFGADHFSTIQRAIKDECASPSVKLVLSLLRLSHYDPDLFYKFKSALIEPCSDPALQHKIAVDATRDLSQMMNYYFTLQQRGAVAADTSFVGASVWSSNGREKDVAFELGRLLMSLGSYSEGLTCLHWSLRDCGEHHITYYNIGLCEYYRGHMSRALTFFERSSQLQPQYTEAQQWTDKIKAKINKEKS